MPASSPVALRPELPELPRHMRGLPLDARGYPVPWFAAWHDEEGKPLPRGEGTPDIKYMADGAVGEAMREGRCWVCGGRLGRYKAFTIGPMCALNRTNAEPPSHLECADFAARACPFLSKPHMKRGTGETDGVIEELPGHALMRNPKCAAVWIIKGGYRAMGTEKGPLMMLPEPTEVRWYAEGREATFAEVEESITTGLPSLHAVAETDEEHAEIDALWSRFREKLKRELA